MGTAFWLRWGLRDLRARWTVVLATGLVLAIGTGLFATLGAMRDWRVASADRSYAALRAHDLRVSLDEGSFVAAGRLRGVALSVPAVAAAQERLSAPVQLAVARAGAPVLVAGRVVGSDLRARDPIDRLWARRGRALTPADSGRPVAMLEQNFARFHGLPDRGVVRAGRERLTYVGHAMAPDWFIVSRAGSEWGAEGSYGVLFTSLPEAQRIAGRPGAVNETVLRLRPGADHAQAQAAVRRAFARALPQAAVTVTALPDEPAHRFLYRDARNDQRVFVIFALLLLLGAALGAFNLVSRVVEAQRREIGIAMALGVAPWRIAIRPLMLGLQIAVLGTVLGVGIALGTAALFQPLLADMLPLPVIVTPFAWTYFLIGVGLGLVLPLAAAALPVWRGVRVAPIAAIRVGFRAAASAGLAGALRRVPVPGRSLAQLPLRNVLRAPRRTAMTVVGIAAVIAVVVALGGMMDSFDAAVGQARSEARHGAVARTLVTLDAPRPVTSAAVRAIAASPAVRAAEPGLVLPGQVRHGATTVDVALTLVDPAARLWQPTIAEGALPPGGRGILLSRRAAEQLGVGVGDRIVLRHPRRTGPATLGAADTPVTVAGIHGSPYRQVALLDARWSRAMGLAGMANVVTVAPARGTSVRDLQRAFAGWPGVASVEEAEASARTLDDAMSRFSEVLQIGWVFALALALLMAFNATSINVEERRREHATMFAFGLRPRAVLRTEIAENVIVGLLATGLGLLLGSLILRWVTGSIVSETMPDLGIEPTLAAGTLAAAGVAGVLALALAPLMTSGRLRRMDVPSTLRVME